VPAPVTGTEVSLGHSMGAYLSGVYLLNYSDKHNCKKLILADPWGGIFSFLLPEYLIFYRNSSLSPFSPPNMGDSLSLSTRARRRICTKKLEGLRGDGNR
jgi:pimeloyl-ACP methyl ester carboxylesterase